MFYYPALTKEEIDNHSYRYLFALYGEYPNRACENLGVSSSSDKKEENASYNNDNVTLSQSDYPFKVEVDENYQKVVTERLKSSGLL